MPWVAASVQDRPSGLVQMACGPSASQPPGPPADPGRRVPQRRRAAARRAHRSQPPAGSAIGGHEELLPGKAVADLGSDRDDGVPRGDDPADGLEHAALLLPGIHADGQRGLRRGTPVRLLAGSVVPGELAELRAVAGEQREREDGHGDQHGRWRGDGRGAAAGAAAPAGGALNAGPFGLKEQRVMSRGRSVRRERGDLVVGTVPQRGRVAEGTPGLLVGLYFVVRGLRVGLQVDIGRGEDRGAERDLELGRGWLGRGLGWGRGWLGRGWLGWGRARRRDRVRLPLDIRLVP